MAPLTVVGAKETRRLASWIDGFTEYTSILSSPLIFRKWAAIGTIAAALERRVWVRTLGDDLFPNLYVVLVGPPGIGKSAAIRTGERLLRLVQDIQVAPTNVSSASIIDALGDAKRQIPFPVYTEFNAIVAFASEFGNFLPAYDSTIMNLLTKVYDGEPIEDRKRTKSISVKIDKPILSILGGTTPSYLNSFLPEGAWDQGFTSRSIFVYSGDRQIIDPFSESTEQVALERLYVNLLHDIKLIGKLSGRITFESGATEAIRTWHLAGGPPVPDHGKLLHYISRRTAHLLKLCMVAAVARGDLQISLADYQLALDWLIEAEALMPEIFKSMGSSSDSQVMEDTWHFIWTAWVKEKAPLPERRIVHFVQQRVPYHSVLRVIEIMVRSGVLEHCGPGPDGRATYKPAPKQSHSL